MIRLVNEKGARRMIRVSPVMNREQQRGMGCEVPVRYKKGMDVVRQTGQAFVQTHGNPFRAALQIGPGISEVSVYNRVYI